MDQDEDTAFADNYAERDQAKALREDVKRLLTQAGVGDSTAVLDQMTALQKQVGDKLKPIPVSAQVLDALDQTKRLDFVGKWQKALGR